MTEVVNLSRKGGASAIFARGLVTGGLMAKPAHGAADEEDVEFIEIDGASPRVSEPEDAAVESALKNQEPHNEAVLSAASTGVLLDIVETGARIVKRRRASGLEKMLTKGGFT